MSDLLSPETVLSRPADDQPDELTPLIFPYEAFSGPAAELAHAVRDLGHASPEIPFLSAFSCVSALCGKAVKTHNSRSGHTTQANTFMVVSASTTDGKGVASKHLLAPLYEMERRVTAQWNRRRQTLRAELSRIEKTPAKNRSDKDVERQSEILMELQHTAPRWITSSPTPEGLQRNMETYGEVAYLFSAEGQSFIQITGGKFTKGHDSYGTLCGMFSGDRIAEDRVGRSAPTLTEPVLTLGLMAQPDLVRQFRSDKAKHVGFLNRTFWPLPSKPPAIDPESRAPAIDPSIVDAYGKFVEACHDRFVDPGRTNKADLMVPMSDAAQLFIRQFEAAEQQRKLSGDLDAESHGRGAELVTRAALVLHVMRHGVCSADHPLELETIQAAGHFHAWCQAPWLDEDRDGRADADEHTLNKLRRCMVRRTLVVLSSREIQRALRIHAPEARDLVGRLVREGKLLVYGGGGNAYMPRPE